MFAAMAGLLDRRPLRPRGLRRPGGRLRRGLRRGAGRPHPALRAGQPRRPGACATRSPGSPSARRSRSACCSAPRSSTAAGRRRCGSLAIVLDFGGPAVMGMDGWTLVPAHFAERHNLVIILALGESIVALGVASEADLTAGVIVAAVLGIGLAAALWWTYFDVVALVTERRLTQAAEGRERNTLARDSYTLPALPDGGGDHPRRPRPGARPWPTSTSPSTTSPGSPSWAGPPSTCWPTWPCGSATPTRSTSSASCSPSCCWPWCRRSTAVDALVTLAVVNVAALGDDRLRDLALRRSPLPPPPRPGALTP